jgi:EmrB/QacA subfamily drug resistance transporter
VIPGVKGTSMKAQSSRTSPAGGDSRWLALVVLCAGMLMIVLDATIVNVALPSIRSDLGFTQSSLAWVVNAYLIAFGGVLLLAGRLGDLLGRRRVFLAGIAVFTVASLLCGLSIGPEMLVAARFIQGVGGAMTSAVILGMVVTLFSEPNEQVRAIGIYSVVAAAGASIGLLAGGFLTDVLNWHWIFLVNIPIGIITAVLALQLLEADGGIGLGKGADALGAFLVTAALLLGVYTIIRTTDFGWGSAHTIGFGAAAIASLVAFVVRESLTANPLVPFRIFESRNVSGANVVLVLLFAPLFGMFFLGSLYFQRVRGYDPLGIGLAFLPFSLSIAILSFAAGPLITRFGARSVLLPSSALMVGGLLYFSRVPVDAGYGTDVLPALFPLGIGFGLAFPSLMALGMSGASQQDSGLASGLLMTTQQVGGALGLSVFVSVSAAQTNGLLAASVSEPAALTSGYRLSFAIGAGLVLVALVVASVVLRRAEKAGQPALQERERPLGDTAFPAARVR